MTQVKNNNYRTINAVFDELFNAFPYATYKESKTYATEPAVNIYENEHNYELQLNVPGRSKEDFKIQLDKSLLTISFEEKKAEENNRKTIRKEFGFKSFKRSFTLDEKINTEGIEAKYDAGLLTVTLPKREEVKNLPKQISVL